MIYKYDEIDMFDGLERPDFSKYSGNLVLWGAGKIGSITAHVLKQKGIKAIAFVDMSKSKQGTKFCGLDIISPEDFFANYKTSHLIITTVDRPGVLNQLNINGFSDWDDAWPLLEEFEFGDYDDQNQMYMVRMIDYYFREVARELGLKSRFLAHRIRVMVTSRCTLNCKECCAFVPYLKNHHDDDWEKIVADIKVVLNAVNEFQEVELYGGEPMLNSDLPKIVVALRREPKIGQISIISNGTVLPSDELIQAILQDKRVIFRVSSYGSLSTKLKEVENILKQNNIRHEIIDYKTWYKNSQIKKMDETEDEIKRKFVSCMEGCGLVYWSGKIYLCQTLPFLLEVNAFPHSDENCFEIRNSTLAHDELVEKLRDYIARSTTDNYIDACKYCTGKSTSNFKQAVLVAEQAKGQLKMPNIFD